MTVRFGPGAPFNYVQGRLGEVQEWLNWPFSKNGRGVSSSWVRIPPSPQMVEIHPFGSFVPKNARYLILGSFTGKQSYDWFYGTKRNQFWRIMEGVYGLKLDNKKAKQDLFTKLGIAITDIIYQCERRKGTNLDANLINIVYNTKAIEEILEKNKIDKIYFSSRFVETKFRKLFKTKVELITLPSPSPRYARMGFGEKIKRYRELLPP